MDNKTFYALVGEAVSASNLDAFVAEWATSSVFDADSDGAEPDYNAVVSQLTEIYAAVHRPVKEIAHQSGMTYAKLAERFCIPLRTVENWGGEKRECPIYTRLMMQECLGLIHRL